MPPTLRVGAAQVAPKFFDKAGTAVGGSCIVNPAGLFVREPVFQAETIVWAEIDLEERRLAKAYFDCLGHYARFDLLSLSIREEAWAPTGPEPLKGSPPGAAHRSGRECLP